MSKKWYNIGILWEWKGISESIGVIYMSIVTKIFGTHSERELKRIYPIVDKVESLRDSMMALSDDQLKAKT